MGKTKWIQGLRPKFFMAFLLVSLLPLTFFAFSTSSFIRDYYLRGREDELKRTANFIEGLVRKGNFLQDRSKAPFFVTDIGDRYAEEAFRILLIDNRGVVVHDTNGTGIGVTFLCPEVLGALNKRNITNIQADNVTMYTAVPIYSDDASDVAIGVVLLVSSVADIYELLSSVQNRLLILAAATIIVILVVVFFLSEFILTPMRKIMRVVNLMGEGHLNQRISVKGRDEFSQLATAFNNMNDKLEQVEKTREEFVSNVSHELKTPLSSMKVLSESILLQDSVPVEMYKEFLQDINSEVDRMTMIVNDLLTLVKLDQRDMPRIVKQIDLNKLIEDVLKRLYPLAEVKDIDLLYEDMRKVSIAADEMRLSLALSNLVENGIKYTPTGGMVKLIIDADHQNAFVTIQDTGIGIAEEELGKIFTRFYRVDKTRDRDTGGTGLGLSITHSTVLLHNGAIRVTSKEGEGTTFVVRLPLHQNT